MTFSLIKQPNDTTTPTSNWALKSTSGHWWSGSLFCSAYFLTGVSLDSVTTSSESMISAFESSLKKEKQTNNLNNAMGLLAK